MLTILSVAVLVVSCGFASFLIWSALQIHRAIRVREERIFKMELAQVEEREKKWEALAESMQVLPERVYSFSHSRVTEMVDRFMSPKTIHTVTRGTPPPAVHVGSSGRETGKSLDVRSIFEDESREPGQHERVVASYSESIAAG